MPSEDEKRRMRSAATRKIEEKTAQSFVGGQRVPRSGARPLSEREKVVAAFSPFGKAETATDGADIISKHYVIDDKRTEGASVGFSRTIAKKIRAAATRHNKVPLVQITFTRPITDPAYLNPSTWDQWVVVPKGVFTKLSEAYFGMLDADGDDDP